MRPGLNRYWRQAVWLVVAASLFAIACEKTTGGAAKTPPPSIEAKADGETTSAGDAKPDGEDAARPYLDRLSLPPGFRIDYFHPKVPNARSLARGDKGTIFVGTRRLDKVYALVDENGDGKAEKFYTIAEGLDTPNGVAFKDGSLYVAAINRILRFDDIESRLADPPDPMVVSDSYPANRGHGWKYIAFGPDGYLYVPVGAPCNICEPLEIYASMTRIKPDGSGREIFAHGIRNTVGFAWHPETGELWFTDNGRDMLGDDIPPDELNRAPKAGLHFGYPYCHGGDISDPEFGHKRPCSDFTQPVQKLGPHVAALGMLFYTGTMFPADFKNDVLIAEHGSWNRSTPIGYRLMRVKLDGNKATAYEPFATGWLMDNGQAWGRPVDVLQLPDGSVLLSDDFKGAVYRITYRGK